MDSILKQVAWIAVALVGSVALGTVALARGESINALWIVIAAVAIYLIGYRYYARFIANNVMQLDALRATARFGGNVRRLPGRWLVHGAGRLQGP